MHRQFQLSEFIENDGIYRITANEQRKLRKKLLRKVGKKCQDCGKQERLEIHHIDHNGLNNHLRNLKILCTDCHNRVHKEDYWNFRKM